MAFGQWSVTTHLCGSGWVVVDVRLVFHCSAVANPPDDFFEDPAALQGATRPPQAAQQLQVCARALPASNVTDHEWQVTQHVT